MEKIEFWNLTRHCWEATWYGGKMEDLKFLLGKNKMKYILKLFFWNPQGMDGVRESRL